MKRKICKIAGKGNIRSNKKDIYIKKNQISLCRRNNKKTNK